MASKEHEYSSRALNTTRMYASQSRVFSSILARTPFRDALLSQDERPTFEVEQELLANPDKVIESSKDAVRKTFTSLEHGVRKNSLDYETIPLDSQKDFADTVFSKGDYLIEDPALLEIAITSLVGSLLTSESSYNFVRVHGISTEWDVEQPQIASCAIYMEKLETMRCDTFTAEDTVQILHAIYMYQSTHRLQHNDLTPANILIRKLDESSTFRGQTLHDADYFRYRVGDVDLYIPNHGYVLCIADFGTSSTWGLCTIVERLFHLTGYQRLDKKAGRCLPKGYCEIYDPLVFLNIVASEKGTGKELATALMKDVIGASVGDARYFRKTKIGKKVFVCRPKLSKLHELNHATTVKLLTHLEIMGKYMKRPEGDVKIVDLGG